MIVADWKVLATGLLIGYVCKHYGVLSMIQKRWRDWWNG